MVPFYDMARIVTIKLTGVQWKDARFNIKASAKMFIGYAKKVRPEFIMGSLETNALFMDLDMK
jgi:hypothetical protein